MTTTVNLAHALGHRGKKVQVDDNDPQFNATSLLLGDVEPAYTLYIALAEGVAVENAYIPPSTTLIFYPSLSQRQ